MFFVVFAGFTTRTSHKDMLGKNLWFYQPRDKTALHRNHRITSLYTA